MESTGDEAPGWLGRDREAQGVSSSANLHTTTMSFLWLGRHPEGDWKELVNNEQA